jgi:hypothetical protein
MIIDIEKNDRRQVEANLQTLRAGHSVEAE